MKTFNDLKLPLNDLDEWTLSDIPESGLTFSWKKDGHEYIIYSTNGIRFFDIFQEWKDFDYSHFVLVVDRIKEIEEGNAFKFLRNSFCDIHEIFNYWWTINNITIRDDELRNFKSGFIAHIVRKNSRTIYSINVNMSRTIEKE